MKVVLLSKSDAKGGAAVVTFRLMSALRKRGIDARMVVSEKYSDSPFVEEASAGLRRKIPFLAERLKIYIANGFKRSTLFKIDTGSDGISVIKHPLIEAADIVCLNWINQGFLSLKEIKRLSDCGKKIVWTMHDMWNMTGICHHAGDCNRFLSPDGSCGYCPLLGKCGSMHDLSYRILKKKRNLYTGTDIHFVAVSSWLSELARKSTLLHAANIRVIPNPFPEEFLQSSPSADDTDSTGNMKSIKIIFGAARLDDDIKGFPTLIRVTQILAESWPEESSEMELITFGGIKNPDLLKDIAISTTHLGEIQSGEIRKIYESGDIVVSTSSWETLPGTLIEGQAWGCIPVAFNHGGQRDIIDHKKTGYLADWNDLQEERALSIAKGIMWASKFAKKLNTDMYKNVRDRFSEEAVANQYISLFKSITHRY